MTNQDKSYIYEDALRQNIAKIDFFGKQENEINEKIASRLIDGLDNYKSDTNSTSMSDKIDIFKGTIGDIYNKRKKYMEIEEKIIVLYHNLTKEATRKFTIMGEIEGK